MKKVILFIPLIILLFVSCKNERSQPITLEQLNPHIVTKLNHFYIDKLKQHKFLLLGEGRQHNDHVMNNAVIELLNYWMDQIEQNEEVPLKIVLILEYSQSFGNQLHHFFKDGDVSHFGVEIQGRTLNTLEFFYDLKDIFARATALKSKYDIDFNIFCPEQDISPDASREEHHRIFMTERDNKTTQNILEYVKQKPDYKFIAFYGASHIASKKNSKIPITPRGTQIKNQGIETYSIALVGFKISPCPLPFQAINSNFALTATSLKTILSKYNYQTDAEAFYKEPYIHTMKLKDIPSVKVIEKALEYSAKYPKFIPSLVSLWHRYTGSLILEKEDKLSYVKSHLKDVNTIESIENLSIFENMLKEFEIKKMPRPEIDRNMFDITCFQNVLSQKPFPVPQDKSANELWMDIIKKYEDEIKISLYTSILFYGTEKEKNNAIQKLKEITNQDFKSAKQWLNFSRQMWLQI